jgi:3-dehydroquinate synthase II
MSAQESLNSREIYIEPSSSEILEEALKMGFSRFYAEPPEGDRRGFYMYPSPRADLRVDGRSVVERSVKGAADMEELKRALDAGARVLLVRTTDWTVIPYENLIVDCHLRGARVFARTRADDLPLLLTVMEKGVDGAVVHVTEKEELERLRGFGDIADIALTLAEVISVEQCGVGDRVCVDTTSMLGPGEGMLVGNTSSFLFLVHNENIRSEYTEARPFRVNAGGVHCYFMRNGRETGYLSEIKAGSRVLIASEKSARQVTVGRAKIERRPLVLIRARQGEKEGSIILQWAETIRLVSEGGKPISVTQVTKGQKVFVHLGEASGRHFGAKVDEFIIEK